MIANPIIGDFVYMMCDVFIRSKCYLYLNNWDLKKSNFLFDTNPDSRVQTIIFSFLSKFETVIKYITLGIRKVHTVLHFFI